MQSTELINRYVYAVGEHLPQKSRADIQAELKSLLQESLDSRAGSEGRPIDQAMTVQVLREFGEPEEVARRYVPVRPLISATTYPTFVLVAKIVLIILSIVYAAGAMIGLYQTFGTSGPTGQALWNTLTGYVGALLANFGLLVLIFAIIDRLPNWSVAEEKSGWNPLNLPAVEDPNRIDRADAIATIVVNAVILIVFNFVPNLPNLFFFDNRGWENVPLFGPSFYQYLPWIYLSCSLEIALYVFVLVRGRWSRGTRIAEIGSGLFGAFIVWRILTDGLVLTAVPLFDPIVKISLVVALVIILVDVVLNVYRLVTRRWNSSNSTGLELAAIR